MPAVREVEMSRKTSRKLNRLAHEDVLTINIVQTKTHGEQWVLSRQRQATKGQTTTRKWTHSLVILPEEADIWCRLLQRAKTLQKETNPPTAPKEVQRELPLTCQINQKPSRDGGVCQYSMKGARQLRRSRQRKRQRTEIKETESTSASAASSKATASEENRPEKTQASQTIEQQFDAEMEDWTLADLFRDVWIPDVEMLQ